MIEVRDLAITLGEFALRDISLEVSEGEYFVILGPTGAGKTVLLECIAGLHQPSAGQVVLDGRDVTEMRPEDRKVAYVPQDYCLFPHMTIEANIAFGMKLRKWPAARIRQTVDSLCRLLRIEPLLARRPATLSGGEKQRVALARALAIEPRVLLLDEPLAAVDERTRERLCDELKGVQQELGTTTIHVSHNFEETLAVADHIGVFDDGRIMQVGTPDDVFRRPADEFVARFTRAENLVAGEVVREAGQTLFVADGVRLPIRAGSPGLASLVVRPEDLRLRPANGVVTRDALRGCVRRLTDRGPLMKAVVETGTLSWSVLLARMEARELGLGAGSEVLLEMPSEALHVLSDGASSGEAAIQPEGITSAP